MQRSFSVVEDDDVAESFDDEKMLKKYGNILTERKQLQSLDMDKHLVSVDSQEVSPPTTPPKIPSAGPSGRQTVLRSHSTVKPRMSSDSDLDDSDLDEDKTKTVVPGEYDPKEYENLDVNPEIREIFQYITKYIPQQMSLDQKFKPFVPEFLPAVGDIDAFIKVVPPEVAISGDKFTANQQLGLTVLDEPAANQSDAALLHLQLRAESVKSTHDSDVVVKKLDNVEKNVKVIDKWIKDISALHKSKSYPAVRYSETMPDLDELMQEWPEEIERQLNEHGFPKPNRNLSDYVVEICKLFHIPTSNKIHALHVLFSLYAAVKSSQLYKNTQSGKTADNDTNNVADQLLLE